MSFYNKFQNSNILSNRVNTFKYFSIFPKENQVFRQGYRASDQKMISLEIYSSFLMNTRRQEIKIFPKENCFLLILPKMMSCNTEIRVIEKIMS